jgi:hypothetical protein
LANVEEQQQALAEAKKQCDYYGRLLGELYKSLSNEEPIPLCIMSGIDDVRGRMVCTMSFIDTIDIDGKYHKKELCNGTNQT